jgi:hypothetical protein
MGESALSMLHTASGFSEGVRDRNESILAALFLINLGDYLIALIQKHRNQFVCLPCCRILGDYREFNEFGTSTP